MSEARVIKPDRLQARWDMFDLEALLPTDHRARLVWGFVESLNLEEFYAAIGSREGSAGRPGADPAVLLALWLYATVEGVGSARELDRLAERDIAYRWLAGGVPVNYHGLSDFRVAHMQLLDRLLTRSVTALVREGLITLEAIAVDGTKVRASVSRGSMKKADRLQAIEAEASQRIETLKRELMEDSGASSRRVQAARERAARDVQARVRQAREAMERLESERKARAAKHRKDEARKGEPKVSTTDPQAREMRFPDGAVRPAYNAQIAATPDEGVIVSVDMTERRNDMGLAAPMVDDIVRRYGRTPERLLVDAGYAKAADIVDLSRHEAGAVIVFAPVPKSRAKATAASRARLCARRAREPQCLKDWRERMQSAAGQAVFALRKRIEQIHADRKNHGFGFIPVRGLVKAKAVALWHALAHNLIVAERLRAKAA